MPLRWVVVWNVCEILQFNWELIKRAKKCFRAGETMYYGKYRPAAGNLQEIISTRKARWYARVLYVLNMYVLNICSGSHVLNIRLSNVVTRIWSRWYGQRHSIDSIRYPCDMWRSIRFIHHTIAISARMHVYSPPVRVCWVIYQPKP